MNCNKVLSLIGLSTKAGKIVSGEFSTEKAVKTGKAWLVIVSAEASDNTKKKFHNMCTYYEVPCYDFGGKEELGRAMGKEFRASLAVLDEGFSKTIMKELEKYMREIGSDIAEVISDASPEEKALMKNKLSTIVTKL